MDSASQAGPQDARAFAKSAAHSAAESTQRRPGPAGLASAPQQQQQQQQLGVQDSELGHVWRHLKQLEQAVKGALSQQQQAPPSTTAPAAGGSILDGVAASPSRSTAAAASPAPATPARLRASLSALKSEIADRAVKEVEAVMLQQRVLHLEAVLAGMTGGARAVPVMSAAGVLDVGAGAGSPFGSFAGSVLQSAAGAGSAFGGGGRQQQGTPSARTSGAAQMAGPGAGPAADVSLLYDRLGGMEAAMQDLAHAQAASSAALSQLGGRMAPPSPGAGYAPSAGSSPVRGSVTLQRPPSCPLLPSDAAGAGGYWTAPLHGHAGLAAAPPPATHYQPQAGSRHHWARGSATPEPAASPTLYYHHGVPPSFLGSPPAHRHHLPQQPASPPTPRPQHQHQPQWQVDVVLAGHDAELAAVRGELAQLQAASAAVGNTAAQVAGLQQRVALLEQHRFSVQQQPAAACGGDEGASASPTLPAAGSWAGAASVAASAAATAALSSAGGGSSSARYASLSTTGGGSGKASTLDAADVVSAIEGLADDSVQASARLAALEAAIQQQDARLQGLQDRLQQLPERGHPGLGLCQERDGCDSDADSSGTCACGGAPATVTVVDALLQRLLGSTQLAALIVTRVQQALQDSLRLPQARVQAPPTHAAGHSPASMGDLRVQLGDDSASTDASQATQHCVRAQGPLSGCSSRYVSSSQIEHQVAALQQEVAGAQLEAVQHALEGMAQRVAQLQEQQAQQAGALQGAQAASAAAAASCAALAAPLEGRLDALAQQAAGLAAHVAVLQGDVAESQQQQQQQPARIAELQQELQQLAQQLADGTAASATAVGLAELRADVAQVQQQQEHMLADLATQQAGLARVAQAAQAAADAAAEASEASAAAVAATAASSAADRHAAAACVDDAKAELLGQLAALQAAAAEQAREVEAAAARALHSQAERAAEALAAHAADVRQRLQRHEEASTARLLTTAEELTERQAAVELRVQERADAQQRSSDQLAALTARLEGACAAQEELSSAVAPLQAQLAAVGTTLRGHADALSKLAALEQLPAAVGDLSARGDELAQALREAEGQLATRQEHALALDQQVHQVLLLQGQLQELHGSLAQQLDGQAAALEALSSGAAEVKAGMAQQLAAAEQHQQAVHVVEAKLLQLQAAIADDVSQRMTHQQAHLDALSAAMTSHQSGAQQQHELLLSQLQALQAVQTDQQTQLEAVERAGRDHSAGHAAALQQLRAAVRDNLVTAAQQQQEQHAAAAERLASARAALQADAKSGRQALLALEQQLAELQQVVDGHCIKTDQLGTIFAARNDMYGAWLKMQAVFDANRRRSQGSGSGGAGSSSSCGSSPPAAAAAAASSAPAGSGSTAAAPPAAAAVNELRPAPAPAAAVFDPFVELAAATPAGEGCGSQGAAAADGSDAPAADAAAGRAAGEPAAPDLTAVVHAQLQLRQEVGSLAVQLHAALADVSQQLADIKQGAQSQQQDAPAVPATAEPAASAGSGVLHAPLALVVQVQQELARLREDSVSRDRFAAVVTLVKELRGQAAAAAAAGGAQPALPAVSAGAAADAQTPAAPSAADMVSVQHLVGQLAAHTQQLAAMQASVEALLLRLQGVEEGVAAACNREHQQQQQGASADAQAELRTAAAAAAAQHAQDAATQHAALQGEVARLATCVDDLAAKVHTAVNAAAAARGGGGGGSSGGCDGAPAGFGEMVAGLANLKACIGAQAAECAALGARLDSQEGALQGLLESASAARGDDRSTATAADNSTAPAGDIAAEPASAGSAGASASRVAGPPGGVEAALSRLVAELLVVQARLAALEGAAQQAPHAQQRRSHAAAGADVGDVDADANGRGGAADASSTHQQPIAFMHGLLVDMRKRLDKVEAEALEAKLSAAAASAAAASDQPPLAAGAPASSSAAAAAAAAAGVGSCSRAATAPASPACTPKWSSAASQRGGARALAGVDSSYGNSAGSLEEVQEVVAALQGDVAALGSQHSSLAAMLESLQGDVGAAAAAAAQAAATAAASALAPSRSSLPEPAAALPVHEAPGQAGAAPTLDALWQAVQQLRAQLAQVQGAQHAAALPSAACSAASPVATDAADSGASGSANACQPEGGVPASVQQLSAELSALPAPQQAAFLGRLAGVVSRHATRLLATYHMDDQLAAQLQGVQAQLAAVGAGAGEAAEGAGRRLSASPGSIKAATAAAAAAAAAGGPSHALLCILDQVASLRAIGSATHPAISEALHRHEAQLEELRAAQDSQAAALQALGSGCAPPAAAGAQESTPALPAAAAAAAAGTSSSAGGSSQAPAGGTASGPQDSSEAGDGDGEAVRARLAAVESQLAAALRALAGLRSRAGPLQEVADATQAMMRELQVAHGLTLQRLEVLEGVAAAGAAASTDAAAAAAAGANDTADTGARGSALAVAGALQRLQADVSSALRRLAALEGATSSAARDSRELAAAVTRLAARGADADGRGAELAAQVSGVAALLPGVAARVAVAEGHLGCSLRVAKQGLDILADQLVALGALNARRAGSPSKNPLAALGAHHVATTALEAKVEALRTAMAASVKLMIQELAATAADINASSASGGSSNVSASSSLGAGAMRASAVALSAAAAGLQAAAQQAAAASQDELALPESEQA